MVARDGLIVDVPFPDAEDRPMTATANRLPVALLAWCWRCSPGPASLPHDRFTWLLEVAPVLIGVPVLLATGRRFPLTPLLYTLLAVHACILMVGGKYTYAEVPVGFWVRTRSGSRGTTTTGSGTSRRGSSRRSWRGRSWSGRRRSAAAAGCRFVVVAFCLAFSAFYELIEWWTAVAGGGVGDRLPRHPGRRLGHAVGHVPGAHRGGVGAARPFPRARPPAGTAAAGAVSPAEASRFASEASYAFTSNFFSAAVSDM